MPPASIHIGSVSTDFTQGLNTYYAPSQLTNGATPFCQNVDFNRVAGSLTKRKGHTVYSCGKPGTGFVNGIHQFIDQNQVETLFAAYCQDEVAGEFFPRAVEVERTPMAAVGSPTSINIVEATAGVVGFNVTSHGLSNGDVVFISGLSPDTAGVNNQYFHVTGHSASTFNIDASYSGGNFVNNNPAGTVLAGTTGLITIQLTEHGYTSGDRITFGSSANWGTDPYSLSGKTYQITVSDVNTFTLDGTSSSSRNFQYAITGTTGKLTNPLALIPSKAETASWGVNSLYSAGAAKTITKLHETSGSTEVVTLTVPTHGLSNGDSVEIVATNFPQGISTMQASSGVVTFTANNHGFTTGDTLHVDSNFDPGNIAVPHLNTNPRGLNWVITVVNNDQFKLVGITSVSDVTLSILDWPQNYGTVTQPYLADLAGIYEITNVATNTFDLVGTFSANSLIVNTPGGSIVAGHGNTSESIAIVPPVGTCEDWVDVYGGSNSVQTLNITEVDGHTNFPTQVRLTIPNHGLVDNQIIRVNDIEVPGYGNFFGLTGLSFPVTVLSSSEVVLQNLKAPLDLSGNCTGTVTTLVPDVGVVCGDINFATFADICIAVGVEIPTLYWYTGISPNQFIDLTDAPPANGQQITVFQNSVFIANTSAGSSRIHWCAPNNPFDWTTVNQAGFIDVNPNDGDFITGLAVISGYLFIFKRHSVYILSGAGPTSYAVAASPAFDGCVYGRSIVNIGTFIDYLSYRAVLSTAPGAYTTEQSVPIKPNIEGVAASGLPALTPTTRRYAVGGLSLYQYWLALDSDGDGNNDAAYVFDYVTASWTYYTNINANVFTTLQDKTLIAGASDSINVYVYQQGEVDYGQASNDYQGQSIPMVWISKEFDSVVLSPTQAADFQDIKTLQDIAVRAPALAGGSITVNTFVNGADQNDLIVVSLDATATTGSQSVVPNSQVVVGWSDMLTQTQGNTFQLQLSDNTPDSPVIINAIQCTMDVELHLKWGNPSPSTPAA